MRKKALTNNAILLARDNLPGLLSNLTSNTMNKLDRKKVEKALSEQENNLLYFFQIKDMNDIIEIRKPLEHSGVLHYGVTETVKHKMRKQGGGFLWGLLAPLAT